MLHVLLRDRSDLNIQERITDSGVRERERGGAVHLSRGRRCPVKYEGGRDLGVFHD